MVNNFDYLNYASGIEEKKNYLCDIFHQVLFLSLIIDIIFVTKRKRKKVKLERLRGIKIED